MSLYSLVKINRPAPNFSLLGVCQNQTKLYSLPDLAQKWLVLYFYSNNFTPNSASDLKSFQENLPEFQSQKIQVLGISTDSTSSHLTWSEELKLTFPLLADIGEHQMGKDYNVYSERNGNHYPAIFVVDPESVLKFYQVGSQEMPINQQNILEIVQTLAKNSKK